MTQLMDETTYRNLSNRWSRGIDWCVTKVGRKWEILSHELNYPETFKTKREAYERVTMIVLTQARLRQP